MDCDPGRTILGLIRRRARIRVATVIPRKHAKAQRGPVPWSVWTPRPAVRST